MLPILQQQPRGNSPMSGEHHVQRFLEDERPLLPSLCICVGIVNAMNASVIVNCACEYAQVYGCAGVLHLLRLRWATMTMLVVHHTSHIYQQSQLLCVTCIQPSCSRPHDLHLSDQAAVTGALHDLHPGLNQASIDGNRDHAGASSPPDLHLPDQAAVTGPQQGSASPPELPAEQHRAIPSVIRDSACASEGVVGPVPAKRRSSVTTVDLGGPEGPLPFVSVPATPKGKVPPPCCSQAYPEVCVYVYVCLVNACSQPRCLSNLCAPLSYKKFPAEKFSAAALPSNLRCPAWDSGAFVLSVSIPPMLVHLCYEALFETLY
eukprot:scaffold47327_cov18-Tisochrysis_lutea.AAC.1